MRTKAAPKPIIHAAISSFILLIGLFLATHANALDNLAQKEAKFDALYEQLLSDPSDVDATLEYAELAVEIGDYEAAIPPMERLLISNPSAHKLKLELGVLYYLLGSYDMAKTYLGEVTSAQDAPAAVKTQANQYLTRM